MLPDHNGYRGERTFARTDMDAGQRLCGSRDTAFTEIVAVEATCVASWIEARLRCRLTREMCSSIRIVKQSVSSQVDEGLALGRGMVKPSQGDVTVPLPRTQDTGLVKHRIDTDSNPPITLPPRRISPARRQVTGCCGKSEQPVVIGSSANMEEGWFVKVLR